MENRIPEIIMIDESIDMQPVIFRDIATTLKAAENDLYTIQISTVYVLYKLLSDLYSTNDSSIPLSTNTTDDFIMFS